MISRCCRRFNMPSDWSLYSCYGSKKSHISSTLGYLNVLFFVVEIIFFCRILRHSAPSWSLLIAQYFCRRWPAAVVITGPTSISVRPVLVQHCLPVSKPPRYTIYVKNTHSCTKYTGNIQYYLYFYISDNNKKHYY